MARRSSYSYYDYYEPTRPIEAKGGIKAQSKRGFGENWWAKRWMAVLEDFGLGARLNRGKSYARSGQVLSIDVANGAVESRVQGSSPKPYRVTIQVKPLSKADWTRLAEALSGQALFAAKLLAGEMPNDIETAFASAGLSLFPKSMNEIVTNCSCPDWSNPCKHIAAVYCLLGEEFDRNPFLIFKLRGIEQQELAELIGDFGGDEATATPVVLPPEPLPMDAAAFWTGTALPDGLFGEVQPPPVNAALPKRLGGFPFWRGQEPLLDTLTPIYAVASGRGMEAFLGEGEAFSIKNEAPSEPVRSRK